MSRRISISQRDAAVILEHLRSFGAHRVTPLGVAELNLARALATLERKRPSRVSHNHQRREAAKIERAKMLSAKLMHKSRKPSKAEKREARAAIREAVFERAGGRCEGPAESDPREAGRCVQDATDLSHLFGRGRGRLPESARTCAAWCRTCHVAFGVNRPSGASWWAFIANFLGAHGLESEARYASARAHFVEARSKLGAGLKERSNG